MNESNLPPPPAGRETHVLRHAALPAVPPVQVGRPRPALAALGALLRVQGGEGEEDGGGAGGARGGGGGDEVGGGEEGEEGAEEAEEARRQVSEERNKPPFILWGGKLFC